MKGVLFRVRRIYYDQIAAGTKKFELRAGSGYWRTMLFHRNPPDVAVFICGREPVLRFKIKNISLIKTSEIPALLGRPISDQGIRDLNLDKELEAIKVDLGEKLNG